MKLLTFFILFLSLLTLATACSGGDDKVSVEGRMLHINMADFYVYSPDGVIDGIDTIHVQGGRFEYSRQITTHGTLVIVFPNYSEVPLFVEPGSSLNIEGDAQHLKELDITGSDANESFTQWRKENANKPIIRQKDDAAQFVQANPDSPVSLWLIRQYYVMSGEQDIPGAMKLLGGMLQSSPENLSAKKMQSQLTEVNTSINVPIGSFTAKDINGNTITEQVLLRGNCIVMTMASWNFESQNMLRHVADRRRGNASVSGNATPIDNVVVLSLDADRKECIRTVKGCNADNVIVLWDGKQLESPLLRVLHLSDIPDDIVLKDGKIIQRSISIDKL